MKINYLVQEIYIFFIFLEFDLDNMLPPGKWKLLAISDMNHQGLSASSISSMKLVLNGLLITRDAVSVLITSQNHQNQLIISGPM